MVRSILVRAVSFSVFILSFSAVSLAQGAPAGLMKRDAASTGKTDVAKEGFQQAAQKAAEATDETKLDVMAGGMVAGGNSGSLAVTGASKFLLRRGDNQLTAAAATNYALSRPPKNSPSDSDESWKSTVENVQGNVRYDRFLTDRLSLFLGASTRYDRFQGLDLRLNIDPGVAYYFVQEEKQKFWGEVGYDFQFDVRSHEMIVTARDADPSQVVKKTDDRHSARLFLGYDNQIYKAVGFFAGLEYLQGIDETTNWRLNGDAALTSSIGENFSLATSVSVKYDHHPLPFVKNIDVVTALNLIYKLI
jgi:putative salt-induced outer membrane protein